MRRARPLLGAAAEPSTAEPSTARIVSWPLAAVADTGLTLGLVTTACGLAGLGDDNADAAVIVGAGLACAAAAFVARRRVAPPPLPGAGRVFAGIGMLWTALVLFGAALYAGSGTLTQIDDALVESAAGFTTTSLTLLDAAETSRSVLLFRSASSWVGGLTAVMIAVVTLPTVLRSTSLIGYRTQRRGFDLVPNPRVGTRRVLLIYCGFTALCWAAYLLTGLGFVDALVLASGTVSTGGFTGRADSLAGFGFGAQLVAFFGMLLAGAGVFVIWWMARGRLRPLWRSGELRAFLVLLALATPAMALHSGVGWGEAAFMAVSAMSTTGFAVSDWTVWGTAATVVLLVGAGIGSMMGSPGGGLKVMRAQLLMGAAGGELRRQLDPRAVVLVRRDDETLTQRTLDRLGGHQIAYVTLVGAGAMLLGVAGGTLVGSVWGSVSAVSTFGPAMGEIGAFGQLSGVDRLERLALAPVMMAGRMPVPSVLAGIGLLLSLCKAALWRGRYWRSGAVARLRGEPASPQAAEQPRSDAEQLAEDGSAGARFEGRSG